MQLTLQPKYRIFLPNNRLLAHAIVAVVSLPVALWCVGSGLLVFIVPMLVSIMGIPAMFPNATLGQMALLAIGIMAGGVLFLRSTFWLGRNVGLYFTHTAQPRVVESHLWLYSLLQLCLLLSLLTGLFLKSQL